MNPFDYLNSINGDKKDIMETPEDEKEYNAFLTNRMLSQFPDSTLFANEMNINHGLDNRMQYDFLRLTIRKGKRRSKMVKPIEPADIDAVKEYYGYSNQRAKDALCILTQDQIEVIKSKLYKGGKKKPK